jgi:thymidylate kinase
MSIAAETGALAQLVQVLFSHWKNAGIEFVVLRNYEELPYHTSNDIDILVSPRQRRAAESLLRESAHSCGWILYNRVEFSPVSMFFWHPFTSEHAQFDLFHWLKWRGFTILPAQAILDNRVDRGLFCVPTPAHEAVLNLLTRFIYHGRVKESYKAAITNVFRAQPTEVQGLLADVAGKRLARELLRLVSLEQWDKLEQHGGQLRRAVIMRQFLRRPHFTAVSLAMEAARLLRRIFRPPGVSVLLFGPDGVGKSAVIARLQELHALLFRRSALYHFCPMLLRKKNTGIVTEPHQLPPRSMLVSWLKVLYYFADHWLGYLLQLWPAKFQSACIIFDRHFDDLLIDPRRYRIQRSAWLVRVLRRLLPPRDRVYVLDAPPEVVRQRKTELSVEELARQRAALRQLAASDPHFVVVDATAPIEAVARTIARDVIESLAARQQRRDRKRGNG